jgi:hypothetical protein
MDLRKIEWDGMDCVDLAQDRNQQKALANTVIILRVPLNAGKFFEYLQKCQLLKKVSSP